jgi:hypothetical protein
MFRSRLLIDRRILRTRRTQDNSAANISEQTTPREENNNSRRQIDKNNNFRTTISNNFDFIEPCDVDAVDSLDSLEVKNWKYHLTNNKF